MAKIPEEERLKAFAFLRERYPNTFRLPGDIKPLEVGLGGKLMHEIKDILPTVGIRPEAVHAAIRYYVCTKEYVKARRILNNPRVNLQGEIAGEVTEEHIKLNREHNAKTREAKSKRKAFQREIEAKRLEKQKQQETAALKKAQKEAARKAQEEAIKKKQQKIKEMSLRKPKVQTKVTAKPTVTIKSKKVLSLKKNKE